MALVRSITDLMAYTGTEDIQSWFKYHSPVKDTWVTVGETLITLGVDLQEDHSIQLEVTLPCTTEDLQQALDQLESEANSNYFTHVFRS